MRYALVDTNNKVVNVIELPGTSVTVTAQGNVTMKDALGDTIGTYSIPAHYTLVKDTGNVADIGMDYQNGSLVDNRTPVARIITPLQFIDRFTLEEQAAISAAALSSAEINLWLAKAMGAQEINPVDPRTVAGMNALVQAGLLTEDRKNEILR